MDRALVLSLLGLSGCFMRIGGGVRAPLDDEDDAQGFLEVAAGARFEVAPGRARLHAGGFGGGVGQGGGLAGGGGGELGGAVAWRRGGRGHVAARLGVGRVEPEDAMDGATLVTATVGVAAMTPCSDTICIDERGGGFLGIGVGVSAASLALPERDARFVGVEVYALFDPLQLFTMDHDD